MINEHFGSFEYFRGDHYLCALRLQNQLAPLALARIGLVGEYDANWRVGRLYWSWLDEQRNPLMAGNFNQLGLGFAVHDSRMALISLG